MKTIKRTTITVETLEKMVVQFNQDPPKVFCENCRQPISEMLITKIAFTEPISESENIHFFITESGVCFFLKIL